MIRVSGYRFLYPSEMRHSFRINTRSVFITAADAVGRQTGNEVSSVCPLTRQGTAAVTLKVAREVELVIVVANSFIIINIVVVVVATTGPIFATVVYVLVSSFFSFLWPISKLQIIVYLASIFAPF